MTTGGVATMVVSLVFVWGLTLWSFRRVLMSPQEEKAPSGFGP